MYKFLLEAIFGLLAGLFLGITGIVPTGVILIVLDYLKIGNYKTNLGSILFINLFPITVGSVYQFYKAKQINFSLGFILLFSIKNPLSNLVLFDILQNIFFSLNKI